MKCLHVVASLALLGCSGVAREPESPGRRPIEPTRQSESAQAAEAVQPHGPSDDARIVPSDVADPPFETEPRDDAWASPLEAQLRERLAASGTDVRSLECRSRRCRALLGFAQLPTGEDGRARAIGRRIMSDFRGCAGGISGLVPASGGAGFVRTVIADCSRDVVMGSWAMATSEHEILESRRRELVPFFAEVRDETWASAIEALMRSQFEAWTRGRDEQGAHRRAGRIERLECRTTLCLVEIGGDEGLVDEVATAIPRLGQCPAQYFPPIGRGPQVILATCRRAAP